MNSTLNSTTIRPELLNSTTIRPELLNATVRPFDIFYGCEKTREGLLFDLIVQSFNLVIGLPANILVLSILIRNRREPSTSDIFLGCLAFMDAYFGIMVPISFLNMYYWNSTRVLWAMLFGYGVKDTSGPLFLSCICLDRFLAVVFPITFGQLKDKKYRVGLSAVVLSLTFSYASTKIFNPISIYEKIFTGQVLATFTWMVICNISILWALKKSRGAGKDEMHPMKQKAFKMVRSLLAIIVCNYFPQVVLFPFQTSYSPLVFNCYVKPIGFAFLNISSTIQPLVYLSRLEKIPFLPQALTKKLCCKVEPENSPA